VLRGKNYENLGEKSRNFIGNYENRAEKIKSYIVPEGEEAVWVSEGDRAVRVPEGEEAVRVSEGRPIALPGLSGSAATRARLTAVRTGRR